MTVNQMFSVYVVKCLNFETGKSVFHRFPVLKVLPVIECKLGPAEKKL